MEPKVYVFKDPKNGEEVEVAAPPGMDEATAYQKAFGRLPGTGWVGSHVASGVAKGLRDLGSFGYQSVAGLGLAGARGIDAVAGTQLLPKAEEKLAQFEGAVAESPLARNKIVEGLRRAADFEPTSAPGRYLREGVAGATAGAIGPARVAKMGATLGATGGVLAEGARQAELGPLGEFAAAMAPFGLTAAWKAFDKPLSSTQLKAVLADTKPEDFQRARDLIERAKARGVELSPAQAFGPDHPLVPLLERVGASTTGSAPVKTFLGRQTAPANQLTDQVSAVFGNTDTSTAANTVAQKAAAVRQVQERRPSRIAGPYYDKAKAEPLAANEVEFLRDRLEGLKQEFALGPNSAGSAYIDDAIKLLSKGTKTVEDVSLAIDDATGMMSLVRGQKRVDIPLETYGELKSVRDELSTGAKGVQMAGGNAGKPIGRHITSAVEGAIREGSRGSANMVAADALFEQAMRRAKEQRKGPLQALAGPDMRGGDQAANFNAFTSFLDPAKNSPRKVDQTLRQLIDPQQGVVQKATAGYLRNVTEGARRSEGYAPARIAQQLRGGEGSGKQSLFDVLVRRAIEEQNLANPGAPLDLDSMVKNLNTNLDIMRASGLGRNALSRVDDAVRVGAQLDTTAQLARGSAGNLVSLTPSFIRRSEAAANKELADALTDPSMAKMTQLRDYSRAELVAAILRQAAQTGSLTSEPPPGAR